MTRDDRIRAFILRTDGASWEAIGAQLHYDPRTVARSLHDTLRQPTTPPKIIYPAIRRHVLRRWSGSVGSMAHGMGVSPYRLRRVLIHGDPPPASLTAKLMAETGLTREELYQC